MKVKMVKGRTFCFPRILGWEDVVVPGDVLDVDAETGEYLLESEFLDKMNNAHPYFVEVPESTPAQFKQIPEGTKDRPSTARVSPSLTPREAAELAEKEAKASPKKTRRRRAAAG